MSEKWEAVCLNDTTDISYVEVGAELVLDAVVCFPARAEKIQKEIHRVIKLAAKAPEMLELLKEYCDPKIRNPINMVKLLQKTEGLIKELEVGK